MALITKGTIITLFMDIRYYFNKDMLLYRPQDYWSLQLTGKLTKEETCFQDKIN